MEKIKETQKGFYGCYWPLEGSTCAIIAMLGDDCEDGGKVDAEKIWR